MTRSPGHAMTQALKGLTQEQRTRIRLHLRDHGALRGVPGIASAELNKPTGDTDLIFGAARKGDTHLEGWSIYRSPTTINPPHTVRLLRRDTRTGKLLEVISISEKSSGG